MLKNKDFRECVEKVRADGRFRSEFHHAIIKHKNRYVVEYVFYIENEEESIQFFLIFNIKSKTVKIVDYYRKTKEPLKPLVSNVVESIDIKKLTDNK